MIRFLDLISFRVYFFVCVNELIYYCILTSEPVVQCNNNNNNNNKNKNTKYVFLS